jgi:hypothetical protein
MEDKTMKSSIRRNAAVIASGVLVALGVWALAKLIGVDPTVGKGSDASPVVASEVALAALVAGLGGWSVHSFLERRRLVGWWPFTGSTTLAISMIGPSYLSDGASAMALMSMHFAVGIVLIWGFMRGLPNPWWGRKRSRVTAMGRVLDVIREP